jgi:hypothetical protein
MRRVGVDMEVAEQDADEVSKTSRRGSSHVLAVIHDVLLALAGSGALAKCYAMRDPGVGDALQWGIPPEKRHTCFGTSANGLVLSTALRGCLVVSSVSSGVLTVWLTAAYLQLESYSAATKAVVTCSATLTGLGLGTLVLIPPGYVEAYQVVIVVAVGGT